jgi:4-hydroxy-tetrahydrodipicolinate synthase
MASPRPRGVIAATATPLLPDDSPDLTRLLTHCRALLEDGCDGINLLGTTGEATAFSTEQRLAVMQAVAASGLPLARFMVGTGVSSLDETVRLTQAAAEMGFAGALVLPPFYYPGVTDDGLVAYMDALVQRIGQAHLAIYLYHIPQNTKVPWPAEVVARLRKKHGATLAGLKDSGGDLAYARSIVKAVPDFDVFPSSEASLAGADAEGFAGCISATTNLTAASAQAAWSARGTAVGEAAGKKAGELRGLMAAHPLVAAVKAALAGRYRDAAWARVALPLLPLAVAQASGLCEALERRTAQP